MPPKKLADGEVDVNKQLRDNYNRACRALAIDSDSGLIKQLTPDEEEGDGVVTALCTDSDLGSAGVRALCAAILAKGATMKGTPYMHMRAMRFWRSNAGDGGAAAVAELLQFGKELVPLQLVEFMDNNIGPAGCGALGESLMLGANKSLLTLRLDNNKLIGDEGVANLVKGLRTNRTLRKLTMSYCGLGYRSGSYLAEALAFPASALKTLDLRGNRLGSAGMRSIVSVLNENKVFEELLVCDNTIGADPDPAINRAALQSLADVLMHPTAALCKVDLEMNTLEVEDAELLLPALTDNPKVAMFTLDDTLPPELFSQLVKMGGGGKKKGKKGKKGGKKKKKK